MQKHRCYIERPGGRGWRVGITYQWEKGRHLPAGPTCQSFTSAPNSTSARQHGKTVMQNHHRGYLNGFAKVRRLGWGRAAIGEGHVKFFLADEWWSVGTGNLPSLRLYECEHHQQFGPCLVPQTPEFSTMQKERFSVTSNLWYMHKVLNVNEIKN
jgi:hypothetical protein